MWNETTYRPDQTRPWDDPYRRVVVAYLTQCGGLLVVCVTAVGRSDRLFRCGTQGENIR